MRIERLDETTRKKSARRSAQKKSQTVNGTYEASVREILDEVKTDVTKPCSLIRKNLTVQHLMRIIFR